MHHHCPLHRRGRASLPTKKYSSLLVVAMFPQRVFHNYTTLKHHLLLHHIPATTALPPSLITTLHLTVTYLYYPSKFFHPTTSTNIPQQAEKVAKASAKAEPSVTARSSVTTSKASPSPPSVVSRVVEASSVFLLVSPPPYYYLLRDCPACCCPCFTPTYTCFYLTCSTVLCSVLMG